MIIYNKRAVLLGAAAVLSLFFLFALLGNPDYKPDTSSWSRSPTTSTTANKHSTTLQKPQQQEVVDTSLLKAMKTKQEFFCTLVKEMDPKTPSTQIEVPARPAMVINPFNMNLYPKDDIVSSQIIFNKAWDEGKTRLLVQKLQELQPFVPKDKKLTFLDIGANVGWFTLVAASAGFDVIAVEPMIANHMLLRPSICANKGFGDKITLYDVGLNDKPERCFVFSGKTNLGDGTTACSTDLSNPDKWNPNPTEYEFRSYMDVSTLDTITSQYKNTATQIGLVKIDVEGFEPWVIKGGKQFFSDKSHRPAYVFTEFSPGMMRGNAKKSDPLEYLMMWEELGYNIFKDSWTQGRLTKEEFKKYVAANEGNIVDLFVVARSD